MFEIMDLLEIRTALESRIKMHEEILEDAKKLGVPMPDTEEAMIRTKKVLDKVLGELR